MARTLSVKARRRHSLQWALLSIVVVTLALGWKYPLFGYTVPLAMMTGIAGGFFRGRYVCGNICPRGSFADRLLSLISLKKPIPRFFRGMIFRWIVLAGLVSFMMYQMANKTVGMDWPHHAGLVFWRACALTTALAVLFGVFIHQRTWCAFCPIGTLSNVSGRGKYLLRINANACRECKACEKVCPMRLSVLPYRREASMLNPDCLKCSECVWACPKKALSFDGAS